MPETPRQEAILETATAISRSLERITRAARETGDENNQRELMRGLQNIKAQTKQVEGKIL